MQGIISVDTERRGSDLYVTVKKQETREKKKKKKKTSYQHVLILSIPDMLFFIILDFLFYFLSSCQVRIPRL